MALRKVLGGIALALSLTVPAAAQTPAEPVLTQDRDPGPPDAVDEARHQGPGGYQRMRPGAPQGGWQQRQGRRGRSLLGMILRNREQLGLSASQVASLQKLQGDYQREAIRRQADLRIARLDLVDLMRADPSDPGRSVDTAKAETKIREIERMRGDMRVARLRTVEAGKAQLTAEQRAKLVSLFRERWRRGGAPAAVPPPMPRS